MIKIKETVVVEGKYDKIKLDSILDATVIAVDGFRIFTDKETLSLLRALAEMCIRDRPRPLTRAWNCSPT